MKKPAGKVIPEKSAGFKHCGTGATGWINGTHPTQASKDGIT